MPTPSPVELIREQREVLAVSKKTVSESRTVNIPKANIIGSEVSTDVLRRRFRFAQRPGGLSVLVYVPQMTPIRVT